MPAFVWLFKACRFVTYTPEAVRKCALHPEALTGRRPTLFEDKGSIVFDLTEAALHQTGITGCDTRPCQDTEMCAPIRNVKRYRCIPLYSQFCSGSPPSVVNSIITSDGVRTMNYVCKDGYVQSGHVHSSTCNPSTGQWSSVHTACRYTDCGTPTTVTGTVSVETTSTGYGSTVTYVCLAGAASESASMTITCQSNSKWTAAPDPCMTVFCGASPTIQNSIQTAIPLDVQNLNSALTNTELENVFGAQVNYTCVAGYTSSMGRQFISECLSDGSWSPTTGFECNQINCGAPQVIENADVESISSVYNSRAYYTCTTGYQFNHTITVMELSCGYDATWSGEDIECLPVDCHAPPDVALAEKNYTSTTFNSTVVYTCIDPAVIIGQNSDTRVCQTSGQWSSNTVECASFRCGPAPVVENAMYPPVYHNHYGHRALYECKTGYEFTTGTSIYKACGPLGQWKRSVTCQPISCRDPPVVQGATLAVTGSTYQSIAIYTCNTGLKLNTSASSRTCSASGTWSDHDVSCVPITCPIPPEVLHADVSLPRFGNVFHYGDIATYNCDPSYVMATSNNSLRCLDDGWQNKSIRCQFVECGDPPTVLNSTHEVFVDATPNYVECNCLEGFTFENPSVISKTCFRNLWTNEGVKCVPISCGDPPDVGNGTFILTNATVDSQVQYVCFDGFQLMPANSYRTCQANGSWSNEDITCQIIDCGIPAAQANSQSNYSNTTYGSVVTYVCLTGFTASSGISWIKTCMESGSWEALQRDACEIVNCGLPDVILNGFETHNTSVFRSTAVYECNPGYALNGTAVKTCSANGQWEGDNLSCILQVCPLPPTLQNAATGNPPRAVGARVSYECVHGYEMFGVNSSAVCLSDLTWSQTDFECIKISCGQPPSLENGKVDFQADDLDSIATYTCLNNMLPMNNQTTRRCQANRLWSNEVIEFHAATDLMCPAPPSVPNAQVYYSSFKNEATARYVCQKGYEHWWFEHQICIRGKWLGRYIHCGLIDCGIPPDVLSATKEYNSTTYRSDAKYICQAGTSPALPDNTKICKEDGNWSNNVVECIQKNTGTVSCGVPAEINNADITYNSTLAGSVATIHCKQWYTSSGTEFTAICNSDGVWEMPTVVCSLPGCDREPAVENSLVRTYIEPHRSVAVYDCNVGFVHTGTQVKVCGAEGQWSKDIVESCLVMLVSALIHQ